MAKTNFILNTVERIVAILIIVGVGFKLAHWPGASVIVLLSGILFFIASMYRLINTINNKEWTIKYKWGNAFSILTGIILATGIIFKQQHYPFANLLIYFGSALFLLAVILTNWKLPMSKKQMVIAATFCLWVLLSLIFNVKHSTYKSNVQNHLIDMLAVNQMMTSSLNDETKNKVLNHFYEVDSIIKMSLNFWFEDEIDFSKEKISEVQLDEYLPNEAWIYLISENGFVDSLTTLSEAFITTINDSKEIVKNQTYFNWKDESKVHLNINFPWRLLVYKRLILKTLLKEDEILEHPFYISNERNDKRLSNEINNFIVSQSQFETSIIWAVLFFFFTLYANLFKIPIKVQKPLIFVGVFILLEFVLLTLDPILQNEFNNGYLVALVEVGLAALVIPFHGMVEHNLYNKELQNES